MATKKDLVEAHSFGRRRLVTAFVSGAPGGREVEPARPMRAIGGGVALAVLICAGAAILGVLKPHTPDDWHDEAGGLVISKDGGATYYISRGGESAVLSPVLNPTSGKLLSGTEEPVAVDQEDIDTQTEGPMVGIDGAPFNTPSENRLLDSGWVACTQSDHGIQVLVSPDSGRQVVDGGAKLVEAEGGYYLIAPATVAYGEQPTVERFTLPSDGAEVDDVMNALGFTQTASQAVRVDIGWVNLFDEGGDLTEESFPGAAGMVEEGDTVYLKLDNGDFARMTAFSAAVYQGLTGTEPEQGEVSAESVDPVWPEDWPADIPTEAPGDPCAMLRADAGTVPTVGLVEPVAGASAAGVDPGTTETEIAPGYGAYVRAGQFRSTGGDDEYFISASSGLIHPLKGEAAARLGYSFDDAPAVPKTWLDLFEPGVTLDPERAAEPPDTRDTGQGTG